MYLNVNEIKNIENITFICDLEANGLLWEADKIWCLCAIDEKTDDIYFWDPEYVETGLRLIQEAKDIVFHNLYGYDHPLAKKLYPWWDKDGKDTLIMSCLFDADRPMPQIPHGYGKASFGTHSIEAWGLRFGQFKPAHENWSKYSEEMKHRCIEDTQIGKKTYLALKKEQEGWDWEQSLALEHKIAKLHGQQILNGVLFDQEKAYALAEELCLKIQDIEEDLLKQLPLRADCLEATLGYSIGDFTPVPGKKKEGLFLKKSLAENYCLKNKIDVSKIQKHFNFIDRVFLKNGKPSTQVTDWKGEDSWDVWGPFSRIEWQQFNLNSDDQIKKYLLNNGWVPDEWNYKKDGKYVVKDDNGKPIKTSPKLTESSFHTVSGTVPKLIAKRAVLKHRLGMIFNITTQGKLTGWLNIVRPDGRIEAGGLTTGTPTARYKHFGIVNCPKPTKDEETGELVFDVEKQDPIYGTQLRELFIVPSNKKMVGCDAISLETGIQSHFVYNRTKGKKLAASIASGDFKKDVARVFTKPWRDSKNGYYALLYGAKIPKFSDTLGVPQSLGKKIYNNFWKENPALNELKNDLEKAYKSRLDKNTGRSFIKGLDGRKLWIRNPSAAMNALFQSSGSILVKTAICYAASRFEKEKIDIKQLLVYHDEIEYEIWPKDEERVCEILKWAFEQASKYWKLNVIIGGDPVVSTDWARVH
jgi:DNA polymerase-1